MEEFHVHRLPWGPGHSSGCHRSDFILMSCVGSLETECSCPVLTVREEEEGGKGREKSYRKDRGKSKGEKEEGWRRREGERGLGDADLTRNQSSWPRAPSHGPGWL